MSKDIKFELNRSGVSELLKGEELKSLVTEIGTAVVERCGDGYEGDVYIGPKRLNFMIKPATPHAYYSNLKHNTILKALK